jgi:DNA-binding transcriptional MocR family regulator
VVKGSTCFTDGRGRDALRLAYSACPAGDMDEGMARLASLL